MESHRIEVFLLFSPGNKQTEQWRVPRTISKTEQKLRTNRMRFLEMVQTERPQYRTIKRMLRQITVLRTSICMVTKNFRSDLN